MTEEPHGWEQTETFFYWCMDVLLAAFLAVAVYVAVTTYYPFNKDTDDAFRARLEKHVARECLKDQP